MHNTTALDEAAFENSFTYDGTYDSAFDDFFITSIGDSTGTSTQFWGLLLNYQFTPVGGCQQETQPGDEVLWAFDAFNMLYFLQASTDPGFGTTIGVTVLGTPIMVYAKDGATMRPVAWALIGGVLTDGNGTARLNPSEAGKHTFKTTKDSAMKSNAITVIY